MREPIHHPAGGTDHMRRAFTIIELLISIAVIFLLVTTALVALRAARRGADRTVTLNALRQMMTAHAAYSANHDGRLLPGYIAPSMFGTAANKLDIKARLPNGHQLNNEDAASYVWRLAPYLDNDWKVFMADYRDPALEARFDQEYGTGSGSGSEAYGPGTVTGTQIGIARHPSIGLNSMFVGGDSFHGGILSQWSPWHNLPNPNPNSRAVSRMSQAKSPTKLIVFAPTQAAQQPTDLGVDVVLGYPELRAPFLKVNASGVTGDSQWYIEGTQGPNQGKILPEPGSSSPMGMPIDRFGEGKLPIAHLDGSVETEFIQRLGPAKNAGANASTGDPSRWLPFSVSLQ